MESEEACERHGAHSIHKQLKNKFSFYRMIQPRDVLQNIKNRKKSRVMLTVLILFMLIGIPTLAILDTKNGINRFADARSTTVDPLKPAPVDFNGVFVTCNVTAVDNETQSFLV